MKKKILMVGPARGHNIQRYLDLFQKERAAYQFTFANYHYNREFKPGAFPEIEIINVWNLPRFMLRLLRKNDIIWIHMYVPIPLILVIFLFRRRSAILNFNIWGESIPRKATGSGIKAWFYRYIMRYVDHVMCPWYATYNIITDNLKGVNAFVHPMGMNGEFFDLSEQTLTEEASRFISQLPSNKTKFYFPKSFSLASDHDLIVEASKILVDKGVSNFVVYFWMGNQLEVDREENCKALIDRLNLTENVLIIHHSFLPTYDIQTIWRSMDAGLQIAKFDLLSTTILEPMFLDMEFIATKIPPYEIIEEKYNVDLDLIPLNKDTLADKMLWIINGGKTDAAIKEKRKRVVIDHFNTDKNIPSIVSYLLNEGKTN